MQILGTQDVPQRGLGQQTRGVVSVLHVGHWDGGIGHAVVDDSIHRHRHRVLGENLQNHKKRLQTLTLVKRFLVAFKGLWKIRKKKKNDDNTEEDLDEVELEIESRESVDAHHYCNVILMQKRRAKATNV